MIPNPRRKRAVQTGVMSIHHPARGSMRVRCPCGRLMHWPYNPKPGRRIPESHRNMRCHCGILHTR